MINLRAMDRYRARSPEILAHYGSAGDETCGVFAIPSAIDRAELRVVASAGEGWDHVSVSRANRCPNWLEMEQIKRMFFAESEAAMQIHVPTADHISVHPHCLHLWRPHDQPIPRPPEWMVA